MKRVFLGASLLLATMAAAQTPSEVQYSNDFQSQGTQANPPGWIDNPIGNPRHEADGLYKTWPDPLQASNIVYGTRQSSGQPDGNNPRIGTFSTLTSHNFSSQGRFEYRGRMIRTSDLTRIGLTFFSSYTDTDRYYLIGLWSQPSGGLSMQLFGFGAGTLTGTVDSNFLPDVNVWYRFVIQADDVNDTTRIRARFWRDGTAEPSTHAIDAIDAAAGRLRSGKIGLWSAVRGDAYIDDVFAKSPVDHTAPVISILESGNPLADGSKFNRNATPEIRVSDDLSTFDSSATLDGAPYTSLTPVTTEGWHVLKVTASDGPGNLSEAQVRFLVDKTPPVVVILEGTAPFPSGFFFNRNVIATANVTDISQPTYSASLDGQTYELGAPITAEGPHAIAVTAVDEVGWTTTAGPIPFTIDKTAPVLTFTSHAEGDVVLLASAVVKGGSDDAVSVTVGGAPAAVDAAAKTFTSATIPLLEGENPIVAAGTDRAGNVGTATLRLHLDTRAPALTIVAPAADACIDTQSLQVRGTATDPRLERVKVTIGATTVDATLDGANWTATIPVADEEKKLITVEAIDRAGHTVSASRSVVIDRTVPVIEIRENGENFAGGAWNRNVAFLVRAEDANANVTPVIQLDGAPYANGTPVTGEGSHTLTVSATDCAGHASEKTVHFSIDKTAPGIRNLVPANGGTVGTLATSIAGETDADVVSVEIAGTPLHATPQNGAFTIASVPFEEGLNRFTLTARDGAGNSTSVEYSVRIRTTSPMVEIRESGSPIAPAAIFNRPVTPIVRAVEPDVTVSVTLNGAPYTSGTTISNDGDYTLRATGSDGFGHTGIAEATFTIDRTPPAVDITSPSTSTLHADEVEVRGTTGDSLTATLNGEPLTLTNGAFVITVPLGAGDNALVLTGRDRAGNTGRDEVIVTRDDIATGVIISFPPDQSKTNRAVTDIIGRVLTPGRTTGVVVGTAAVQVDPTGGFRVSGYPLVEGLNTITATATASNGFQTSASVRVTADFTPPALTINESGQPLTDGARFAERAVISLQTSDAGGTVVTELLVDGTAVSTTPFTITSAGGHSLAAVARDLAGNETRVERTLFIGAAAAAGCTIEGLDPADGSIILANKTELTGRSGGAAGVKVNGVAALISDGSFCATVELPLEGANRVTILCTDAAGNQTGSATEITLQRVTGAPSITIDQPAEGFAVAQASIPVSGTAGPGVVSADVNGVAASFNGTDSSVARTFSVTGVRLANGLNMLVATGRNAGGRVATASRRGHYLEVGPGISISAPSAGTSTGLPRVTVSGTFTNLDPATIVVSNLASPGPASAQTVRFSDTTGSFAAVDVPLVAGEQTLRVSGRDRLNREGHADVIVRLVAGAPGITIAQPANHASFGGAGDSVVVSGSFQAATGSLVDVNGVNATLNGSSYSASVKFSTLSGGLTPIVARVTQPDGASASASIVVTQLAEAPRVVESFPAANAVEVGNGALLLVLFSQPMDAASLTTAFRL